jgi:signal transduction histidine kinase/DNA-binding NarL/FixJ family response regulator
MCLVALLPGAGGAANAAEPLLLRDGQQSYAVGRHFEYLEDKTGTVSIDDILNGRAGQPFVPSDRDTLNFGFNRSAYWFRAELRNLDSPVGEWLLESQYQPLDHIDAYLVYPDRRIVAHKGGRLLPFSQREVKHRNVIFKIPLEIGEQVTVYLAVRTEGSLQLAAHLWSPEALHAQDHDEQIVFGIYYGVLIAMFVYNLMIYLTIRDISYLYYLHFIGCSIFFAMSINGLALEYLWPNSPGWGKLANLFFNDFACVGISQFSRHFLELKRNLPRFDTALRICTWLFLLLTCAVFYLDYALVARLGVISTVVMSAIIVVAGTTCLLRRIPQAQFFMLAWSALLIGLILFAFKTFGLVPSNIVTNYGFQVSSALEGVLLSFALAHRMRILKEANERIQREAAELLEQRVKQRTAELDQALISLSNANRAKSAFLSNMSHELRSPLNVILGFSRLLAQEPGLSQESRSDLGIVVRSGEHLYRLINQVLDISKIEAGHTTLNEEVFDLYELRTEIEEMFGAVARQKGLQFAVDCPPDLPRHLRADAVKLRQVLFNLVSNAIKFTAAGGVALRIRRMLGDDGNDRVAFSVIDTGVGIAAEELENLGKLFVQAKAGRQAREGTGLGLAISRSFVQLMGGTLRITSKEGAGTSVSFDIPLKAVDDCEIASLSKTADRRATGLAPGQPPYRILVVDDRADARTLLVRLLGKLGFELREAANGVEAVSQWREWRPQLIFMDMRMPVMDGLEATRRIKAEPGGRETVIVALTASTFEEEQASLLEAGCDAYMSKPFREPALFDLLRDRLGAQFLYEDDTGAPRAGALDVARLGALPAEVHERLRAALASLDVAAIESAIEAVRPHDAALARELAELAGEYQYERITELMAAPQAR